MAEHPKAIWLNCDPGHDDAIAILLATHTPSLLLLGISTEAGNQTVVKTTLNAQRMLYACGRSYIPVAKGKASPLTRQSIICPEIHGESGLDGPTGELIPRVDLPILPEPGAVEMYKAVKTQYAISRQKVIIVSTGAMTNIALAILMYEEMKDMAEVVLMGGAMGQGNTGSVAEFNIQIDPEAASIVFNSGIPIVMVPLEVTHTALVSPTVIQRILPEERTPFSDMIEKLLMFFAKTYREVFGFQNPPLHDPLAVAYVINPDIFQGRVMRVDVETLSSLSFGQTVCDIWDKSPFPKNVKVCTKVDLEAFWSLLAESIRSAEKVSPLRFS